ncbi:MTH1187 family thiamine-binding protein [Cohnella faecalis]|uniref:Thiamine-binding protein n=1 Tax=Cohnella faecalis TaxID=2315694 RepID=A0A398CYF9_9BACL|nr:MTH1187 family thiamine-binding protein [Cohnella faecalis]RIE04857.1 thiamine-binding protein [Cohnella faecalis]
MAIVQVTVVPIGTGTTSLSGYVAALQQVLDQTKESIHYELTPMSTIIEGDLDVLLRVVKELHEKPFEQGAWRVSTSITIDDRRDKAGTMAQKLESVKKRRNEGSV